MPQSRKNALTKRIAETRPVDRARRLAVLSELKEARRALGPSIAGEEAQRFDAALLLMEFMSRSEEVATAEALAVVAGLVSSLDERFFVTPAVEAPSTPQPAPASDAAPHGDLRVTEECLLGTILVQAGIIDNDALQKALGLQASNKHALGQCLIQIGAATPVQIASAVAFQDLTRETASVPGPEKASEKASETPRLELRLSPKQKGFVQSFHAQVLGEILIRQRVITRQQLERALRHQRAAHVHIGEALVEIGATTWGEVRQALEAQRQLRRSA